jgi:uncharacterized protein YbaR (Trm112 family)
MFIELTDHLRCPADHDEAFLVLLPDVMEDRSVKSGQLGCPVCNRTFRIENGVLDIGGAPPAGDADSALDAEGLTALAGVNGPGGYMALVGPPASLWKEVAELQPGVALVGINPAGDVTDQAPRFSVIKGHRIPIKSRAMRGVVLGKPYADDPAWVREAARVVLPGLRIVGEGADPPADVIELMASAGGAWVGTAVRKA